MPSVIRLNTATDDDADTSPSFDAALAKLRQLGGGRLIVGSGKRRRQQQQQQHQQQQNDTAKPDYTIYRITRPIQLISNLILELQEHVMIVADYQSNGSTASHSVSWPIQPYGIPNQSPASPRAVSVLSGIHVSNVTILGHESSPSTATTNNNNNIVTQNSSSSSSSIVDGNGSFWWSTYQHLPFGRPYLLEFQHSSNITVSHIQLQNAPAWNVHLFDCDQVHIQHISIYAPEDAPNTDGFDPNSSRNVLIEDSFYAAGDDCVAIKSGWDCFGAFYNKPAVNITIRNTICHGFSAGIAIGSELSGGVENVTIQNVTFTKANKPVDIKTSRRRGGFVKNVLYEDILVKGSIQRGIHIDMFHYNDSPNPHCPSSWQPAHLTWIQNITIRNVNATLATYARNERFPDEAIHLWAYPDHPMHQIVLDNVHFPTPPSGVTWNCSGVVDSTAHNVHPWPPCAGFNDNNNNNNSINNLIKGNNYGTAAGPFVVLLQNQDLTLNFCSTYWASLLVLGAAVLLKQVLQ